MPSELDAWLRGIGSFRSEWVSSGWSWDRRFSCAASTFGRNDELKASNLIAKLLPNSWDSRTVVNAPRLIGELAESTGGVRADQLVFASETIRGTMTYGLWWPWGGEDSNISLRIGLVGLLAESHQEKLRDAFGAEDD